MIVWGKRKLAYLINKQTHGYYVIFTLNMEPDSKTIQKIEQYYRQHDNVLRTMPVRIDKKIASEEEEKPEAKKEESTPQEPAASEHEDETDKEKEKSGSEQNQDTKGAL